MALLLANILKNNTKTETILGQKFAEPYPLTIPMKKTFSSSCLEVEAIKVSRVQDSALLICR